MCETDLDCPGNQLCYYDDYKWVRNREVGNICACSTWFGYVGDDCTNLGVNTIVLLLFVFITGIMGIIGIILSLKTIKQVFDIDLKALCCKKEEEALETYVNRRNSSHPVVTDVGSVIETNGKKGSLIGGTTLTFPPKKRNSSPAPPRTAQFSSTLKRHQAKKKKKFNAMNATTLVSFFGILFYFLFRFQHLIMVLTPGNTKLREETNIEGLVKAPKQESEVEVVFIVLTGIFMSLSLMNLSLVWIDNVRKIKTFTKSREQKAVIYKKFLLFLNVVWVLGFILIPPQEASILIIILCTLAAIFYTITVHYLKDLESTITSMDSQRVSFASSNGSSYWIKLLLTRMILCRRRILIGTFLTLLGGGLYAGLTVGGHWREYSPEGKLSLPMIANELLVFGVGFNQFSVVHFLYVTAMAPLKSKRSRKPSPPMNRHSNSPNPLETL